MDDRGQVGDWDATLTLWRESISPDHTAEDSIRVSSAMLPMLGKNTPRFRSLETAGELPPDFELGEKLGSGGMGVVYAANQTAFNREVAVKMVKPGRRGSALAADALMAEAVVTGRLEHPNVVPVYDLGVDAEGNLFYAMKEVQGFPWSKLMAEKTLDENLDILLRVADTISFAHSRGILHRDLKPHNIMLGEFGETMVMDWGASCAMADFVEAGAPSAESSFCGTPAYMPPEMAKGDTNRLGEASDVYLLGAILYQIVSGHPPRREKDPILCISLAAENHIDPVEDDGELLRIALKAMAAAPVDRFSNVRKFQQAVREYRSHSESLLLLENAKIHLFRAKETKDYDLFSRAIYGFREALELWPKNPDAEPLRIKALLEYAHCAFDNADLELAHSLLDSSDPVHRELLNLVSKSIRDRDAHKRRNRQLVVTAFVLGVLVLVFISIGFFMVRGEHRKNLAALVSAHYGEQNHEATVATFWAYHNRYGMDSLDEETLLDVRVAAAMDPWRGAVETGIDNPIKTMPAAEEDCVWVVGERALKKIKLESGTGYDSKTIVAIHHYKFGKHLSPGKIVESIQLPFVLASGEAVHESVDGTLWAGSGSAVYRKNGGRWEPVLEVSKLEFPPLSDEFGFDEAKRGEFLRWMEREARNLRITGLLLNRAEDRAVIALGGGVVCWIDLLEKRCLGWYFVDMDTPLETLKYENNMADFTPDKEYGFFRPSQVPNGPQLLFSPDEQMLLYREGCRGTFVFAFKLPSFVRKKAFYSRLYRFGDFAYPDNERCWGMLDYQGIVFSASTETLSRYWGSFDGNRPNSWDTPEYATRRIPFEDWQVATLAPNAMQCFLITRGNVLFSGSTVAGRGFDFQAKIVGRDWVDGILSDSGTALVLAADGSLHAYDVHSHAVQGLDLGGKVVDVCSGHHPDHLFAILEKKNGKNDVLEIAGIRSAAPTAKVLASDTEFARICCDPKGRWLVAQGPQEGKVFDLATGKMVGTIPSERGTLFPIKFDEKGEYLLCGGEWVHMVKVHRSGDWEKVQGREPEKLGIANLTMHWEGDEPRVLAAMNGATLKCLRLGMDMDDPSNRVWAVRAGNSGLSILPYVDPETGRRRYWMRTWFDHFQAFDASNGKYVSEVFTHWRKKELKFPAYNEDGHLVLFPTESGRVELALRSDLYPVFDPRFLDRKVDRVALATGDSMAAMVTGDDLLLMNLSGRISCKLPGVVPVHYVSGKGLNIWPYDSWITAATDVADAIRSAKTGETVLLDDGVFHADKTLVVQDAIAIRSRNGSDKTSLTTDGNGVVLHLRSKVEGLTSLEGITITGGNGPYGGGLFIKDMYDVLVTNCVISGNKSGSGGAVYLGYGETLDAAYIKQEDLGSIKIVDSRIADNESTGFGGGINTWIPKNAYGWLEVESCEISGNRAAESGGGMNLYAEGIAPFSFVDCVISNNTAGDRGGGIYIHAAKPAHMRIEIEGCGISGNSAGKTGGGVNVQNRGKTSHIEFSECRISDNQAKGRGTGCFVNDPSENCSISNTVFIGNSAKGGTLIDCTFSK